LPDSELGFSVSLPRQTLSFSLHDEVEGRPLTSKNVDLLSLHQFMGEVIALVQGDFSRSEIGQPSVSIEDGSVKLVSLVPVIVAASLHHDLAGLAGTQDLDAISPKRAEVIENWQARAAKAGSKRRYDLLAEVEGEAPARLEVDHETHYRHLQLDSWVHAEKYLTGRVVDLGGKTRPNVHLVLISGESVKIDATENQLEGADYLYKTMTLNVSAKEHIRTGEIRQVRLIDVVKPLQEVDEDKLKALWRKGKEAWAGINSPTEWVEQLRES
jgi:hypothetical protein